MVVRIRAADKPIWQRHGGAAVHILHLGIVFHALGRFDAIYPAPERLWSTVISALAIRRSIREAEPQGENSQAL